MNAQFIRWIIIELTEHQLEPNEVHQNKFIV